MKGGTVTSQGKNPHSTGLLIAAGGVIVLSFDALLVRLADSDPWTVSFWRGLLISLSMAILVTIRGDWRWRPADTRTAVLAALIMLIYGINTGLFVFSVSYTHAANTVVILASAPFFAALFSRWFLREPLARRTRIAIIVSLVGVTAVFGGSMGAPNWRGDAMALVLAMSTGGVLTLLRHGPDLPRTLLVSGAGLVTAAISWPLATPLSLEMNQFGWLLLMGCLQMPIASFCLMMAPKYLPSPEVSLFLLIETVLGPIWVWAVLQEEPELVTLIGGALILVTIAVHSWLALRASDYREPSDVPPRG